MSPLTTNPRNLATTVLERVEKKGSYSNLTLDQTLKSSHLSDRDKGLLTTIVYGVIQHRLTLDFYLAPFVRQRKLDPWVKVLLEGAVYQMVYLDKVPNFAIFNDATEIAKHRGHAGIDKFVNAVLRNLERQGLPKLSTIKDPIQRVSTTYSVPVWLVKKLSDQLGAQKAESIFASINQPAGASLRVNTTKTTREELSWQLAEEFPDLKDSAVSPFGLVAPGGHLAATQAFLQGLYTMQDESSMLVAPALDVKPDSKVLDACAAPGGKTTHIAQYLDPDRGGKVTALDLHANKVKLIAKNAYRMGLAGRIDATALDARDALEKFGPESYDRVLVDAPCSGLGLMRRKPEIRYEKTEEDIDHLHTIQTGILASVAPMVKPGGRLVYSTCTMVKEENQEVVAAFLADHPQFKQVKVVPELPLEKAHGDMELQLFPDDYMTDGFFIAAFVRQAD